jgi:hypothetical protein
VTIAVAQDGNAKTLLPQLQAGSLVTAHIALRRQRIASLVFTPLRRWLQ